MIHWLFSVQNAGKCSSNNNQQFEQFPPPTNICQSSMFRMDCNTLQFYRYFDICLENNKNRSIFSRLWNFTNIFGFLYIFELDVFESIDKCLVIPTIPFFQTFFSVTSFHYDFTRFILYYMQFFYTLYTIYLYKIPQFSWIINYFWQFLECRKFSPLSIEWTI